MYKNENNLHRAVKDNMLNSTYYNDMVGSSIRREINTPSTFVDAVEEFNDTNRLSIQDKREITFMAIEAINDPTLTSPSDIFKKFGVKKIENGGYDRIAAFNSYLTNDAMKNQTLDSMHYQAVDYLLAQSCMNPELSSKYIRMAINEQAVKNLCDLGFDKDENKEEVTLDNVKRLNRIFDGLGYNPGTNDRIKDDLILKYTNYCVHSLGVKDEVEKDKKIVIKNDLSKLLNNLDIEEGIKKDDLKDYHRQGARFFDMFEHGGGVLHPCVSGGKDAGNGMVEMEPVLVCNHLGQPFVGFNQFYMQGLCAKDTMALPDKNIDNKIYFIEANLAIEKGAISKASSMNFKNYDIEIPRMKKEISSDKKTLKISHYSTQKTFIPVSTLSDVSKIDVVKNRGSGLSKNLKEKVYGGVIEANEKNSLQDVAEYFARYEAAAKLGMKFRTSRVLQHKICTIMTNGEKKDFLKDPKQIAAFFNRVSSKSEELVQKYNMLASRQLQAFNKKQHESAGIEM